VAGKPVRGGTLMVGMISGGSGETVNPGLALTNTDILRTYQLYDFLFLIGDDLKTLVPSLAVSAEPNQTATTWTLRLRSGVTWHDGKPFTADDVVYTIKYWQNGAHNYGSPNVTGLVDFKNVRKRDNLTVEVPLLVPVAQFPSILTNFPQPVIQNGSTAKSLATKAIGTGPFKLVSFQPGSQSVMAANKEYWRHGGPYVDKLVVDSSFSDEDARLNALLGGQISVMPAVPPVIAKAQGASGQVVLLDAKSTQVIPFIMRVDKGPFADVRVRQAFRLMADRPALVESVFAGLGTVGNDLSGGLTQYFDASLQREQDIEQAKSLLKAAGRGGMTIGLPTAPASPGLVAAATLFAQQAKAAGVTINVQQGSATTYYEPSGGYGSRPFGQTQYVPLPSLTLAYRANFIPGAPFNDTHWGQQGGGAAAIRLIQQAIATTDESRAQELWNEVQKQQFDQGGNIIWGWQDNTDLVGKNVRGVKTTAANYLDNFNFLNAWLQVS